MNVELLKEEIKAKNKQINEMRNYIRHAHQSIAEYLCPFKVGDRVMSPKGERQAIASISHQPYGDEYSFKVFKIKTNGELYKNSQYVYCSSLYKLTDSN
jgi:hypothetical protein